MAQNNTPSPAKETATLGGGCFWCLEAVFDNLKGVARVESGYTGGQTIEPTYDDICTGSTGHAEAVKVIFDPAVITYGELLEVFFTIHDPTTLNRQGNDRGTQYRSVIYYHSPQQKAAAEQVISDMSASGIWSAPIVTEIAPATLFYTAEQYHQEYFERNPNQPYCQFVVAPKVVKAREKFASKLKKQAGTA